MLLERCRRLPRHAELAELRRERDAEQVERCAADGVDRNRPHRSRSELADSVPALEPRVRRALYRAGAVRTRRDDVVAHLKSQRTFRHISEACSLYSGFRTYLNIAAVEPGSYKLDAIVPAADGRGAMLPLHSSITVL